jgi:hypothetical protein
VNRQASKWTNTAITTSSKSLRPIRVLGLGFCARNQVTATLSVELSGGPAVFTIFFDGGPIMHPEPVRFVPAGGRDSFTFTFVENAGPFERDDSHNVEVDCRSPTGRTPTLERATLNVQYQQGTLSCP